jgi:hypothetical protein
MNDLRIPKAEAWQGTEDQLQIKCAEFTKKLLLSLGLPQIAHHCASGGRRNPREASKFKLMLVIPGVPDIFIPIRNKNYSGLYIELKNAKGKPSPEQLAYMNAVTEQGFLCVMVNDLETYKRIVTEYLNERTN